MKHNKIRRLLSSQVRTSKTDYSSVLQVMSRETDKYALIIEGNIIMHNV
jgi:hypothetical protein